ncbi:MAG: hypothetical protein J6B86_01620 [Clostridia bacterium]|nr:hypothetical protein [Clostridia bacterium]
MKKLSMSRELCYLLATLFLAFGAALMSHANFGLSAVVAPAYLLSQILHVSFGTAEYCLQGILVVAVCLLVRKFRWTYLLSFVSAFLYGIILDGFIGLLSLTGEWSVILRLVMMVLGMVLSSLGVSLFFKTYLAPGAYELFVKEVSLYYHLNVSRFKIVYDLVSCAVAVVLSLTVFHSLFDHGIGLGTLLVALVNGLLIGLFSKLLDRHINFFDRFPFAKYFES